MNEQRFWELIKKTKDESQGNYDKQKDLLFIELSKLKPEEIQEFNKIFYILLENANTWELWGAAYVINGGCSDDCFEYFRNWLISQGKNFYDEAIKNPDNLVRYAVKETDVEWEGLSYSIMNAYEKKTGKSLVVNSLEYEIKGEPWIEDSLPSLYPQLWKEFGDRSY